MGYSCPIQKEVIWDSAVMLTSFPWLPLLSTLMGIGESINVQLLSCEIPFCYHSCLDFDTGLCMPWKWFRPCTNIVLLCYWLQQIHFFRLLWFLKINIQYFLKQLDLFSWIVEKYCVFMKSEAFLLNHLYSMHNSIGWAPNIRAAAQK